MRRDDLEAAVEAGVIDAAAAVRLEKFLESRRAETVERIGDESVRFVRGFHDIFITIGIVLLGLACAISIVFGLKNAGAAGNPTAIGITAIATAIGAAIGAWILAEFLTRRRRLVLPSIALNIGFVFFSACAANLLVDGPSASLFNPFFSILHSRQLTNLNYIDFLLVFIPASLAAISFLWRFRLPFAVATFAAMLSMLVFILLATATNGYAFSHHFVFLLLIGLIIFSVGVALDLSDPQRLTTRADAAFWLHLLAAPIVVHNLIMLSIGGFPQTLGDSGVVFGYVALLTFVAILLDRRAPLVSVLGYFGVALYRLMETSELDSNNLVIATLFIIGAIVVLLGSAWQESRRALLLHLPLPNFVKRLAPIPEHLS